MPGTTISIDEFRSLTDQIINLRRALLFGRDRLWVRGEIDQNKYDDMGRSWALVGELFEEIKFRTFTAVASNLNNATSRLSESMRMAELVIASAQSAVDTYNLASRVFDLLDEIFVGIENNTTANIASIIGEIDDLVGAAPALVSNPQAPPSSPIPESMPLSARLASGGTAPPPVSSIGRILQDVDVAKQFYYELTPRRMAILDTIAWAEGTDRNINTTKEGYNIIFTFKRFSDFSKHPRRVACHGRLCSTAAGRYQFLDKTWDDIQKWLRNAGMRPFPSIEPDYQDQAALYLIDAKRKAMKYVDIGNLTAFLEKCSWEWASLPVPGLSPPRSRYPGQPARSESEFTDLFNRYLALWS